MALICHIKQVRPCRETGEKKNRYVKSAVIKQFEYIRQLQSIEALTVLDSADQFHTYTYSFSGITEILQQFERQISGVQNKVQRSEITRKAR